MRLTTPSESIDEMETPTLSSGGFVPVIHKRSSSLPQGIIHLQYGLGTPPDSPDTIVASTIAPVLPLKIGKNSKSRSVMKQSNQVSKLDLEASSHYPTLDTFGKASYSSPLLGDLKAANVPAIPKRHSGRNLVGTWLSQSEGHEKLACGTQESIKGHTRAHSDALSDEVPSLTNYSVSSTSSTENALAPMQIDMAGLHSRHNCIRELYYTEKQFTRELGLAISTLMQKGIQMGVPDKHLSLVFSNLSEIFDISIGLVSLLEQFLPVNILTNRYTIDEREQESKIGRAMCVFLNSDMYRVYEQYTCDNNAQVKVFRRLSSKYRGFHICIGENSDRELPLRSLLQKPVQRLAQYPIFLKHILELLPQDHLDYTEVKTAYDRSRNYCYSINARMLGSGQ